MQHSRQMASWMQRGRDRRLVLATLYYFSIRNAQAGDAYAERYHLRNGRSIFVYFRCPDMLLLWKVSIGRALIVAAIGVNFIMTGIRSELPGLG